MNQELCLVICFFVGVLVFYLLKQSCGCKMVEGNGPDNDGPTLISGSELVNIPLDQACSIYNSCLNSTERTSPGSACDTYFSDLESILSIMNNNNPVIIPIEERVPTVLFPDGNPCNELACLGMIDDVGCLHKIDGVDAPQSGTCQDGFCQLETTTPPSSNAGPGPVGCCVSGG